MGDSYFIEKKKVKSLFDVCFCVDCEKCKGFYDDCKLCRKCCIKRKKKRRKENLLITDKLCGNILSECNGSETVLWQTSFPSVFGTVSVFFGSGCESMDVFINDALAFTLKKGQTQSITLPGLRKLAITCSEGTPPCTGKYCIDLHYNRPKRDHNHDR